MKPILLTVAIALFMCTVSAATQQPKPSEVSTVHKAYDRFEDRTRYWTSPVAISYEYEHALWVSGYFYYRGQGAGKPIENIGLFSFSKSRGWQYLENGALTAIVDGERLPLGQPIRKDSEIPHFTSQYDDVRVGETLTFRIRYSTLLKIANAKRVEMRLGRTEFYLSAATLVDLQSLLAKVKRVR